MAVAFDAKATADTTVGGIGATQSFSNMTIGAGGTALVVFVDIATNGIASTLCTVSGVTWNGVAMTLIGSKLDAAGVSGCYAFGLASPATGNRTAVVSFTGGTLGNCSVYMDAVSFSGTDLVTANAFPSANVLTNASTPSGATYPTAAFAVTTVSGDAACAVMQCFSAQFTTMNVGTLIRTDGAVNGDYTSGYNLAAGASTNIQFGGGSAVSCCGVAFRIAQPSAGAAATVVGRQPSLLFEPSATRTRGPARGLMATRAFPPAVIPAIGALAATEAADTAVFNASFAIIGTLATTEAPDVAAFAGDVSDQGILAATETADVAAFNGLAEDQGILAATEAADIAAFTGTFFIALGEQVGFYQGFLFHPGRGPSWDLRRRAAFPDGGPAAPTGVLATTEAADVAAFTGTVAVTGTLAATEAQDVAAFTGTVADQGVLAATEAQDVAAFTGAFATTGVLTATEVPDVAVFNASFAITGVLAATEAPDTASFTGSGVTATGTLAAVEAPDLAAFTVSYIVVSGTLAAVETPDVAAFTGNVAVSAITGILAAVEAQDRAQFAGTTPEPDLPGPLNFGIRKVISRRW